MAKRRKFASSRLLSRYLLSPTKISFDPPPTYPAYPGGTKAASVISIDFDHLTKSANSSTIRWIPEKSPQLLEKNRIGTKHLIELSEKYSVPMTWAICGQTAADDPESYHRIADSKLQEVGVHTFAHLDVAGSSAEELRTDIEKCLSVLNLTNPPTTFIFPWNREGHFELLKELGFKTYREKNRVIGAPRVEHGLVNIPPTYYVDYKSLGAFELMTRYVDLCISWNSVFHLWLHPWSVVPGSDDNSAKFFLEKTLEPVFSYMDRKRNERELALCSMRDLSNRHDM